MSRAMPLIVAVMSALAAPVTSRLGDVVGRRWRRTFDMPAAKPVEKWRRTWAGELSAAERRARKCRA